MTSPLILASASPFRRSLLENAGVTFTWEVADIDEREIEEPLYREGAKPEEIALHLARAKARAVAVRHPHALVIGSDQTMSLGDRVFHKPADRDEARGHLASLSGKTHQLNSAIALMRDEQVVFETVVSARLTMRDLSPAFIDAYLEKTGDRILKSVGAYQLEAEGVQLFKAIEGDYFTIVGLPLLPLLAALRKEGLWMRDSRETFVNHAFVIGHPIKHSRSPIIHGHWLKTLDLAGSYRAIDVAPDDLPAFFAGIRSGENGLVGGNVTIPHKEAALKLVDEPDALALEIGAANTIWLEDGRLKATNTDGAGFVGNLDASAPGWSEGVTTAVVLGAGGAARAVIQSIRDRGIGDIRILNRTEARARDLADRFGPATSAHGLHGMAEHLADADLLINTTSMGMAGGESLSLPFATMKATALVTDIVYVPLMTPFLQEAERHGLKTVDGLGMLLHQAAPGFERWFGIRPTVTEALRALVVADIEAHG